MTAIAKSRGIEIVDTYLSAELNPDFRTALTKMLPKKPDAIFLAHEPFSFLKTAKSLGYAGLVVSANHVFEVLANSSESQLLEGVYLVDPKITPEFLEKFKKRFNQYPILEAYSGYEALRSVTEAFKRDRRAPQLGMRTVSYAGVAGQIDYTGTSCAGNQSEWGLFQFRNGSPIEIQG